MQRTAIVTGTSSGLGAELAVLLIEQGYMVIGVSRSPSALLADHKANFTEVLGDIADASTCDRAVAAAKCAGQYDLLINCAGVGTFGPPGTVAPGGVEACISTNLTGLILLSEASIDALVNNDGTLVNVASTASLKAKANEAIYCASKWGVRGYTEALKLECKDRALRVVGVYPGGMKTAFWSETAHTKGRREGFMDPKDVANAIMGMVQNNGSCGVSDMVLEAL